MKTIATMSLLALMSSSAVCAGETTSVDGKTLAVNFGEPTVKQVLHYRKMYDKKPFPDAEIYYYSNGLYKIISQGENHYGVYVLQGQHTDETYTVKFISLPSLTGAIKRRITSSPLFEVMHKTYLSRTQLSTPARR